MVKNAGGNKSKRQGRKYVTAPQQRSIRYKKEQDESYAVVTKLFGGPNCEVMCMDGVIRHCIIRNKFRGRDKKDNTIATGVWVLIGIRSWEARSDKPQKSDLLAVYSPQDKEKLCSTLETSETIHLLKACNENTDDYNDDGIDFSHNNSSEYDSIVKESVHRENNEINKHQDSHSDSDSDDLIDVDEI